MRNFAENADIEKNLVSEYYSKYIELLIWSIVNGAIMEKIKLVLPTPDYESKVMDYKREFIENNERIYGAGGLRNYDNYNKWYIAICKKFKEETVREGLSPETTYLAICMEDDCLVGMITIRHHLNEYLLKFGGHIDYSVRKSERQKGYASEMLELALKECVRLNIKNVLVTCDKENIASAKTIIKNGGILDNEMQEGNRISQRYWINIE